MVKLGRNGCNQLVAFRQFVDSTKRESKTSSQTAVRIRIFVSQFRQCHFVVVYRNVVGTRYRELGTGYTFRINLFCSICPNDIYLLSFAIRFPFRCVCIYLLMLTAERGLAGALTHCRTTQMIRRNGKCDTNDYTA